MEFTSRTCGTSQRRWQRTLAKRSPCASIRETWPRSASSIMTGSCAERSAQNWPALRFPCEKLSEPGIGVGMSCAVSCGTGRLPWIRCSK